MKPTLIDSASGKVHLKTVAAGPSGHPPTLRLGTLRKGDIAHVTGLDEAGSGIDTTLPAGELERRLLEMGFVEGAAIKVLHEGFPGRDPIAVQVNDCTIALRRAEALAILVAVPPAPAVTPAAAPKPARS